MAKRGSWYFEGYVSEPVLDGRGRSKNVLVYRGEWYGLDLGPGAFRRCKRTAFLLSLAAAVLFLLVSFFPAQGGMTPWVGGVCLVGLVPLIFLWIGLVNFLPAGAEWELRVFYAGWRRLKRWNTVFLAVMGYTLAAELVFLIGGAAPVGGEIPYLLGVAACTGCSAGVLALQLRHPVKVVRAPDVR